MTTRRQASSRFAMVPARAVDDSRLGRSAFFVLAVLATYGDRDGWCWPSLATLAKRIGVSKQAVSRQLVELERLGYVETKHRTHPSGGTASNIYRIIHDADLGSENDRNDDREEAREGGQPDVAGGQRHVDQGSTSEVDPITLNKPKEHTYVSSVVDHQFETFWRSYPTRKPHQNPKKPARQIFDAALKRGVRFADIQRGVENFARYVEQEHTNPQFIPQAKTWLHQERWADHQEAPEPAKAADGGWL
jgi:hypothetical protein